MTVINTEGEFRHPKYPPQPNSMFFVLIFASNAVQQYAKIGLVKAHFQMLGTPFATNCPILVLCDLPITQLKFSDLQTFFPELYLNPITLEFRYSLGRTI